LISARQSVELPSHQDASIKMWIQLLTGAAISFLNFSIHCIITVGIVFATRHTARLTGEKSMLVRLPALLMITMAALVVAHVTEIAIWGVLRLVGPEAQQRHFLRVCLRELHRPRLWRFPAD
jgi:hypothetical protein